MKIIVRAFLILGLFAFAPKVSQAQILKKLKKVNLKKGGEKILKDVLGQEDEEEDNTSQDVPGEPSPNGERKGKYLSPPSVTDNLTNAQGAARAADYSAARDLVQQAMVGVEMEIGREVLNSLPESVNGLDFIESKDELYSSGMNFVGMGIARYYGGSSKSLSVSIVNNSALIAAYGSLLGTGTYTSDTENTQSKSIRLQGNRAIIQYDDQRDEYEIAAAIGQSTVFVLKGRHYGSEQEMMDSSDAFDLNDIKTRLGEQ